MGSEGFEKLDMVQAQSQHRHSSSSPVPRSLVQAHQGLGGWQQVYSPEQMEHCHVRVRDGFQEVRKNSSTNPEDMTRICSVPRFGSMFL